MDKKDLKDFCNLVIETAKQKGATQAACSITNLTNTEIHVRKGEVEYIDQSIERYMDINIYINGRYSSHSTNILNKNELKKFTANAVNLTKLLSSDKDRSLPDPSLYPKNSHKNLELEDPDFNKVTISDAIMSAKEIEDEARSGSKQVISVTSQWDHGISDKYVLHSNGFEGNRRSTYFSCSSEATVKDGIKSRPEGYYYASARFKSDLPDLKKIGKESLLRALNKIGQKKIDSGKYTLIVENIASRRLLSGLISGMNARSLHLKSSFLLDMCNKPIAAEKFSLTDDPSIKRGLGSRIFDSEGLASKRTIMIDRGILKKYYVSYFYSKKTGLSPTSGLYSNLTFQLGDRSFNLIIKDCKKGIFITDFIGGNFNTTTGDFSMGIQGFLINNGSISQPVNEMNISGNLITFWKNLIESGNDPYQYSSVLAPTLVFKNINVSGL